MGDQAPPPYSLTESTCADSSSSSSQVNPRSLTSYLNSHIAALPNRIRQNQQARNAQQVETDVWILEHLTPIIDSFLTDLSAHRTAPALATLIMVPNSAVPTDAVLSGIEDMFKRQDEVGRIFRVDIQQEEKKNMDSKSPASLSTGKETSSYREFTDWGRWGDSDPVSTRPSDILWWKDEELARRLASYLQPPSRPKPKATARGPVQAAAERSIPAEKPKKGWGLGWRRSSTSTPNGDSSTVSLPVSADNSKGRRGTVEGGDVAGATGDQRDSGKTAEMNVTTEELAFRRENEFGIWESTSGWALVVTVKVYS